jgi:PAS domain S-box-containing protein
MPAAPIPFQEIERLRALHNYGVLDTPPEAGFDDLVTLAARICGTPISLVTLVDQDRQWFKARFGLGLTESPRAASFCSHVLSGPPGLLIVPDARNDLRFADNPFVTGEEGIRFYAGVPLCSPDGHPVGALCVVDRQPRTLSLDQQDALRMLGRQVMAQLELRRSLNESVINQARLVNSQRIAGIGDWDYDFVTQQLLWSDEVYQILGLSRRDGEPSAPAFYHRVHPDDLVFVHREKKAAAEGKRRVDFEHRIIRPDGTVRYLRQITEMAFDSRGNPARESGTIQDITDRKLAEVALRASEARFRELSDSAPLGIFECDAQGDVTYYNPAMVALTGRPAQQSLGRAWAENLHPNDRAAMVEGWKQAANGGRPWNQEQRLVRPDGSLRWVHTLAAPKRSPNGQITGFTGTAEDITERRAAEAALRESEAKYLRAQRMDSIGTLAGGIAHDLNNVLAPIMLSVELLQMSQGADAERGKLLHTIRTSTRRGADLVRQVLLFGKGLDGQRIPIALRQVIDDLEGIIRQTFPRNIRITTAVPDQLWSVAGDPTQLHQVLLNLAVNARDAMPDGGSLTISASEVEVGIQHAGTVLETKAGPHVLLKVADTGHGIPPEVRERIFEPFFTTKDIGKGTGLGLATVHAIIKSHGGFVTVDSEVGKGSTFNIYLPADAAHLNGQMKPEHSAALPRGRDELVLVVDDEDSIRQVTRQTLETFGYRVLTAQDGVEAVAAYAARAGQIALVLTDVMMPGMDGFALVQELRRRDRSAKIIAASGLNTADDAANAGIDGVARFLRKPYTASALLTAVREVIDLPVWCGPGDRDGARAAGYSRSPA